jgi:hypothetical protein
MPHSSQRRDSQRLPGLEIIMRNPAQQNDVQINRIHSGAVCKAIGEGLSVTLGPQSNELPPRLVALMKQLAMDETGGIERMKDFSNASFPPDTIKVMTQALNGALSTLAHPVSSATNRSGNNSADNKRTANESQATLTKTGAEVPPANRGAA